MAFFRKHKVASHQPHELVTVDASTDNNTVDENHDTNTETTEKLNVSQAEFNPLLVVNPVQKPPRLGIPDVSSSEFLIKPVLACFVDLYLSCPFSFLLQYTRIHPGRWIVPTSIDLVMPLMQRRNHYIQTTTHFIVLIDRCQDSTIEPSFRTLPQKFKRAKLRFHYFLYIHRDTLIHFSAIELTQLIKLPILWARTCFCKKACEAL